MNNEETFLNTVRRHRAPWMLHPDHWTWQTPEGLPQGFGLCWRRDVGSANLMWLALDMELPPSRYNMVYHSLCTLLMMHASKMVLGGQPLVDQAACLTLQQFSAELEKDKSTGNVLPLLALLARGRLNRAIA